ncbi:DUF6069 family protein [Actinocatenispora comari]|uniref:Uncharacterized protein n=1 Tax=Actinocatenispora comari TaxID=2807577 RepID=A0A8J4AD68_9ACTN|nr:DUF6069 family protein [Actinocatenispora comari]GIL29381.1 hypothetical protein NUM_46350 [Actinocatenispora comari]
MTASITSTPRSTVALRVGLAAVVAVAANTVVALVAAALDTGGIGMGLTPVSYVPATLIGVLAGTAGWALVARRVPHLLRILVPSVLLLSWIPDLSLLAAGATAANVVGLMLMHTLVASAVVLAARTGRRH